MIPRLSPSELHTIHSRGEGQFVEFKSAWDHGTKPPKPLCRRSLRDKIADAVAAFANADGGLLLVGVDDDGTATGHGYAQRCGRTLRRTPPPTHPPADCRTARLTLDCHEILAFQVPIAPEAVMIEGNGFPYRVGSRIVREPQEVINQRKQAYRRIGYEHASGRKPPWTTWTCGSPSRSCKTRRSEAAPSWRHSSTTASSRGTPATGG